MNVHGDAAKANGGGRPSGPDADSGLGLLVGSSDAMRRLYVEMRECAATDESVFLVGESGSGKERVARTLHQLSHRADADFVTLSCGAMSPERLETELFGDEKPGFGPGQREPAGYLARAADGTLFLDDITEMNAGLQAKLLQVLEAWRTGGDQAAAVRPRLIAATTMEPEEAVERGRLNETLYHRLAEHRIRVPTLRERGEDVILLAEHFLAERNAETGVVKQFSAEARDALRAHDWPGNVRELKDAVRHSHLLAAGTIKVEDLPGRVSSAGPGNDNFIRVNVGTPLSEVERRTILSTLEHYDGDKKKAADTLRISLKTLYNRLKQYNHRRQ